MASSGINAFKVASLGPDPTPSAAQPKLMTLPIAFVLTLAAEWLGADVLYPNGHHGHNVHFLIHALNLGGRSWQKDGSLSARYWSEAVKEKDDSSGLFYYWNGERPRHPNAPRLSGTGEDGRAAQEESFRAHIAIAKLRRPWL